MTPLRSARASNVGARWQLDILKRLNAQPVPRVTLFSRGLFWLTTAATKTGP